MRTILFAILGFFFGALPAAALPSDCLAVASLQPMVTPVEYAPAALEADQVKLTYIGHSSFIIESPGGTRVVTDFAGWAGGIIPDAVTMNRAHSSHFTNAPDPAIKHVLRGWNPDGGPAVHDVEIGDIRIRNVTTDIRGGMAGRMKDGNSIFIFEVAGLCIGHLGHLHHLLGPEHVGLIGRLDIVMVPVDGGYTMGQAEMLDVMRTLKARIVIPMHYFGPSTLGRFIGNMGKDFRLEAAATPERIVSVDTLPDTPKLLVLPGR